MLWSKKNQCVVCGHCSRRGEKIHGRFVCEPCELQMIEDLSREYEDREWNEIQRISNQDYGEGYRIG